MKMFANAFINGTISYGLTLWCHEKFSLVQKIENLKVKTVKIMFGKQATENMNQNQILKLINWLSIDQQSVISNNIQT